MLYVSHISRKLRKKLYEKVYSFHSVLCWSASLCWLARAKSVHLYRKLEIDRDGRVYHKKVADLQTTVLAGFFGR